MNKSLINNLTGGARRSAGALGKVKTIFSNFLYKVAGVSRTGDGDGGAKIDFN